MNARAELVFMPALWARGLDNRGPPRARSRRCPARGSAVFPDQRAGAAGQFGRGVGGRAGQRGGRGVGQIERAGGAGRARSLPENVNYAVTSRYRLSFLESVPEVSAKLKQPETKERKFEDVVKSAEPSAVLVLVY